MGQSRIKVQAKLHGGIGKMSGGLADHFVVTRKINSPELIWNQDQRKDHDKKTRYFEARAAESWQLSQRNECFMCDGHKYTAIFFEAGNMTDCNSKELLEVKDQKILERLKR